MRIGRHLAHLMWALLSLLAAGAPLAGQAQDLIDRRQRHDPRIEPSGVSLDQAVEMAQRRFRAKAVKAETVQSEGKRVHQIRLLNSEGRVWTGRVDAESGAMH
jgi:uncharacterized membrane protein YkoI